MANVLTIGPQAHHTKGSGVQRVYNGFCKHYMYLITLHLFSGKLSRESNLQVMTDRSFLVAMFARVHRNISLMNYMYKQMCGFHGSCSSFRCILVYRHYLNRT